MNHSPDGSTVWRQIDCNFCKVQQFNEKSKLKKKKNCFFCKFFLFFLILEMKNQNYALY